MNVFPQQLLGEEEGGEEEEEGPGQSVQLPHQPVLPPDLGLVHRDRVGEEASRENVYNLVHIVCSEATA